MSPSIWTTMRVRPWLFQRSTRALSSVHFADSGAVCSRRRAPPSGSLIHGVWWGVSSDDRCDGDMLAYPSLPSSSTHGRHSTVLAVTSSRRPCTAGVARTAMPVSIRGG